MKQISKILSIAAFTISATMTLGCINSKEEMPNEIGDEEGVTLSAAISFCESPDSKALSAEGIKTFAVGDQVAVFYTNTSSESVKSVSRALAAEDISDGGKTAIIHVTLVDPAPNGDLHYIYPACMANGDGSVNYDALQKQDGSLATLASNLDLSVYFGNLTGEAKLPASVMLDNPLTIGVFTVWNSAYTEKLTSGLSYFTVTVGSDTYTVSPAAPATQFGETSIYVAMKPFYSRDMSFTAYDAHNAYEKSVSMKSFYAGDMYPVGLRMTKTYDGLATPFTVEIIENGTDMVVAPAGSMIPHQLEYRINGGNWAQYEEYDIDRDYMPIMNLQMGDKVQFRYYGTSLTYSSSKFINLSKDCYIYGNLMSLATDYNSDENAFVSNTILTHEREFYHLFYLNKHIKSHPNKPLILPATTLTDQCYDSMFQGCSGLTVAPVLPATSLRQGCYYDMFSDCTGLTKAPQLPATELASSCYNGMFSGCSSLTIAPVLPAKKMETGCYAYMFSCCEHLTTPPDLPATDLEYDCYASMFKSCYRMTTAPVLPAPRLTDGCYRDMFFNCKMLNSVTCLATDVSADDSTYNWLEDAGLIDAFLNPLETRYFITPHDTAWATDSDSGIPVGWTRIDYDGPVADWFGEETAIL